jgi:hypothetical protein
VALGEARGAFVTCHDADDWSHPGKIAAQVRALNDAPDAIANMSPWVRARPDLSFERFSGSGFFAYPNPSSLMFRRAPVLERLGGWHAVRAGADSEYVARIESAFGAPVHVLGGAPLAIGRLGGGLTDGDLGPGYEAPRRRSYRYAWKRWHERARAAGDWRVREDWSPRPVPGSLCAQRDAAGPEIDILFTGDFRACRGDAEFAVCVLEAASEPGARIGVCQEEDVRLAGLAEDRFADDVAALLEAGRIIEIARGEAARVREIRTLAPAYVEAAETD